MKKLLKSLYVKKKNLSPEVNSAIADDLVVYNHLKRKMFSDTCKGRPVSHKEIKISANVNDYFVTAIEGSVKMIVSSQKELLPAYIEDIKRDISDMEQKIDDLRERRVNLQNMKNSLVAYTKAGCSQLSMIQNFQSSAISFKDNGTVTVGFGEHIKTFDKIFDFEHGWLEPGIKRLINAEKNVKSALRIKRQKLEQFERKQETGNYSVYFGGRKLMKDQTMPPERKARLLHARRDGSMTLAGRNDATCGNFMVHYDPDTKNLSYRGSNRKAEYLDVGKIEFQRKDADALISKAFQEKTPKAWTITDCGNAWRFDLCITLPEEERKNDFYGDGCIGIDINTGFLAYVEVDGCGNPVGRGVLHYPMENRTSEQIKTEISQALETVFKIAENRRKPLVAEDIGSTKRKAGRYSTEHKRNRGVSLFPSALCRQLIESKSYKYGIQVTFVNPAYTSQTGKVKYMGRYGMSIHESAAFVIARRGMGFIDRLPDFLRDCLEEKPAADKKKRFRKKKTSGKEDPPKAADAATKHRKRVPTVRKWRMYHWKKAYPRTREIKPNEAYLLHKKLQ